MSCTKKCNCCPNLIKATNIATSGDVTTITVDKGKLSSLTACEKVCIGLFKHIPVESSCTRVEVTDGTTTLQIAVDTQRWRPCKLKCRSIIVTRFLDDPELLKLLTVKGGC